MPTFQQQIFDKFLAQLGEGKEISRVKIEKLRAVLAGPKNPKADDFVKIFTDVDEGDIP